MNEDHPPVITEEPAPQDTPNPPRLRVPREAVPAGERAIEAAILSHVMAAGPARSVTPTDVAMAMGADWRSKLTAVRRAAIHLAADGQIEILRKGKPVDPIGVKGVIRLRQVLPPTSPHPEISPSDELS
jgi:hypothetical protein